MSSSHGYFHHFSPKSFFVVSLFPSLEPKVNAVALVQREAGATAL
jgi:hypothetical protein